jgi:hypothetical protein
VPTCWPVSRNAQAKTMYEGGLAQRQATRANGKDPAQSLQARAKRSQALVARKADEATWIANGALTTITREELVSTVVPRLNDTTLRQLQEVTGLSSSGCSMIRSGKRTPHPRHWVALAELASSLTTEQRAP